jgi:hypothetical protein
VFSDVSPQFFFQRTADRRLPPSPMNVRLERSFVTLLANEFPHYGAANREAGGQNRIAPLLVPIRADDPLPQIH